MRVNKGVGRTDTPQAPIRGAETTNTWETLEVSRLSPTRSYLSTPLRTSSVLSLRVRRSKARQRRPNAPIHDTCYGVHLDIS
jgi:hypothetical protein